MQRKKILMFHATTGFEDSQTEIYKSFLHFVVEAKKKTKHDYYYLINQKKKYAKYEEYGFIDLLESNGIKAIKLFVSDVWELDEGKGDRMFKLKDIFFDTLEDLKFDDIFVFTLPGMINTNYFNGFLPLFDKSNVRVTFVSSKSYIFPYLVISYLNRNQKARLYHFVLDHLEKNLGETISNNEVRHLSFYAIREKNIEHFPISEMYIYKDRKITKKYKKDFDFVFGYQVIYAPRAKLHHFVERNIFPNDKVKLFRRIKLRDIKINTSISQEEYYKALEKSKFSLACHSNDSKAFSMIRIHECLSRKCIPILEVRSNYEVAFNDEMRNFWESNNLVYDESKEDSINEFIKKLDYDKLMKDILRLKTVRKFYKDKYDKKIFRKLFG